MGKRILFIDDEPEYVRPHITALEESGYEVKLATNPDKALRLLRDGERFDLIILDLIMPPEWETGEEKFYEVGVRLHREIREELGIRSPIIFLSVVRDRAIRRELELLEREHRQTFRFLSKPVGITKLVSEVKDVLG